MRIIDFSSWLRMLWIFTFIFGSLIRLHFLNNVLWTNYITRNMLDIGFLSIWLVNDNLIVVVRAQFIWTVRYPLVNFSHNMQIGTSNPKFQILRFVWKKGKHLTSSEVTPPKYWLVRAARTLAASIKITLHLVQPW